MGVTAVVANAYRVSADDEPEEWKVWLWPLAGGNLRMGQSCEALKAVSLQELADVLKARCDRGGPWWQAGEPA